MQDSGPPSEKHERNAPPKAPGPWPAGKRGVGCVPTQSTLQGFDRLDLPGSRIMQVLLKGSCGHGTPPYLRY